MTEWSIYDFEVRITEGILHIDVVIPINHYFSSYAMRNLALTLCLMQVLSAYAHAADDSPSVQLSITPVTQQREIYGNVSWLERHTQILERNKTVKPEIVFLGDSITHFWSGEPASYRPTDAPSWDIASGGRAVTNLGYGFDYIENALWRVLNGELDGIAPKLIVISLGTNNLGHKGDDPDACERGMQALLDSVRSKQANAKILLLAIYPRLEIKLAKAITETNQRYAKLAASSTGVTFLNISDALTEAGKPDAPSPQLFRDGLHPNATGYGVIAEKLAPVIDSLLQ